LNNLSGHLPSNIGLFLPNLQHGLKHRFTCDGLGIRIPYFLYIRNCLIYSHTQKNKNKKTREKFSLPLKFQGFFNLNPKVSKLAVYPPEVPKNGNLNLLLKFSVKIDGN
jgi:hypothetical protein